MGIADIVALVLHYTVGNGKPPYRMDTDGHVLTPEKLAKKAKTITETYQIAGLPQHAYDVQG